MRTTVTIDSDNADRLAELMRAKKISFKEALNQVLRRGLAGPAKVERYRLRSAPLRIKNDIQITLRLADEMEDAEIARKMQTRK